MTLSVAFLGIMRAQACASIPMPIASVSVGVIHPYKPLLGRCALSDTWNHWRGRILGGDVALALAPVQFAPRSVVVVRTVTCAEGPNRNSLRPPNLL